MSDAADQPATLGWLKQWLGRVLPFTIRTRAEMVKAGLRAHSCPCPECGAKVYFELVGRKDHLRVACANPDCAVRMME